MQVIDRAKAPHGVQITSFRVVVWLCLLLLTLLFQGGCPKNPHDVTGNLDDDTTGDTTRPAAIVDLHVAGLTPVTVNFCWTAPGDDGSAGLATQYDLRLSTDSITPANFDSVHKVGWVEWPIEPGKTQCLLVTEVAGDSTYWAAIKTRDERNNWSTISNCVRFSCPTDSIRTFADTALENIVRSTIGVPSGPILQSKLDSMKTLIAEYRSVVHLDGIQYCRSLTKLNLRSTRVVDLSALSGTVQLRHLNLMDNSISDITAIGSLVLLDTLYLSYNPVSDLSSLSGLSQLHDLALNSTGVSDLSPIAGRTSITRLNIGATAITDLSALSALVNVNDLQAYACSLVDISPLISMTKLHDLGLAWNNIVDITPLEQLDSLGSLSLAHNQIADILPLVNNIGIGAGDGIDLSSNPLSDSSKSTHIPTLQSRGVTVIW